MVFRMKYDIFISYASEDRDAIALPLAKALQAFGLRVWIDLVELKLGDSLRGKIDDGLANCRYGVVLLSEAFFGKHYTIQELNGLAQREVEGQKVILPVWVSVTDQIVRKHSPTLADRHAAFWSHGLAEVVTKIIEVVKPSWFDEARQKFSPVSLPQLRSGREIVALIGGTHVSWIYQDEPHDESEIELIGGFLQEIRDWGDIWEEIDIAEYMRVQLSFDRQLREIEGSGWTVYGARETRVATIAGIRDEWAFTMVAAVRGEPNEVLRFGEEIVVVRNAVT